MADIGRPGGGGGTERPEGDIGRGGAGGAERAGGAVGAPDAAGVAGGRGATRATGAAGRGRSLVASRPEITRLDFTAGADSVGAVSVPAGALVGATSATGVATSATGATGADAGDAVSPSGSALDLAAVLAGAFFAVVFGATSASSPSASALVVFFVALAGLASSGCTSRTRP